MKQIQGFHALWTRPGPDRGLSELETLTAAVSALMYRRHVGPIQLHTDVGGHEVAVRSGLATCYDDVRIDLHVGRQESVNPKVFWAAGKLAALGLHKAPVVMLDMDVILWSRPALEKFTVLNLDDPTWPGSRWRPSAAKPRNFAATINCGMVYFDREPLRESFVGRAFDWMAVMKDSKSEHAMVFAEQWALTTISAEMGIAPNVVCGRKGRLPLLDSAAAAHLWSAKGVYRSCSTYADAAEDYLIGLIKREFPKHTFITECLPIRGDTLAPGALPGEPDAWWTRSLRSVRGPVFAVNPHFLFTREIFEGGKIYFGEHLAGSGTADVLSGSEIVAQKTGELLTAEEIWDPFLNAEAKRAA